MRDSDAIVFRFTSKFAKSSGSIVYRVKCYGGKLEDVPGSFLSQSPSFRKLAESFESANLRREDYLEVYRWFKAGERGTTSIQLRPFGRLVTKVEPHSFASKQGVHAGWIEITIGSRHDIEIELSDIQDNNEIRYIESNEKYFIKYAVPRGAMIPSEKRIPTRRLVSRHAAPKVQDPDIPWRRQKRRKPPDAPNNSENRPRPRRRRQKKERPRIASLQNLDHIIHQGRERRHSNTSDYSVNSTNSHTSLIDAYHSLQRKKALRSRHEEDNENHDNQSVNSENSRMSLIDAYENLQRKKRKRLREQRLKQQRFRSVQIMKKPEPRPDRNRKQNLSLLPSQAEILSQIEQLESQIDDLIGHQEEKRKIREHSNIRKNSNTFKKRKSHSNSDSPGRTRSRTAEIYRGKPGPSPVQRARAQTQVIQVSASPSSDDANLCVICLDKPKSVVIVPCGHVCICSNCRHSNLQTCPVCRETVETMLRVYF